MLQNREIADRSRDAAELSLIAVTEQASATERTAMQEAVGAAEALASIIKLVRDDPEECSKFLNSYKGGSSLYRFVGFIEVNGMMECSSTFKPMDLSESETLAEALESGQRSISTVEVGAVTGIPVVLVNVPVFDDGTLIGLVAISLSRNELEQPVDEIASAGPLSLITFNARGDILTSEQDRTVAKKELPTGYELAQLTANKRQVFSGTSTAGAERIYAVVPLVSGSVFALSSWSPNTPLLQTDFSGRLSALLPFAMWASSLIVAFWALNRLAIKHIRKLGRQMRHFALNRTLPRKVLGENVPHEIFAMESAFLGMANSILQDEAKLEDSLRAKNILLKEVHHRVKNNLQLISSIMNMQIRQAPTDENRFVLQRLQDRILSLATVHKNLYQGDEMTRVDGGHLIREIVSRNLAVGLSSSAGISVVQDYDNIMIGPDDAAPLTLLVSEAVTNALKYAPQDRPGDCRIEIGLKYIASERAQLRVLNTTGGTVDDRGTGLGSRLIHAFARQLNGELEIIEEGETYTLELNFPVPLKDKIVYDY
ncbi:histidine kinase dimerization/phosphoacceptor domain -containing protein [Sulfitobacter sp. HNIBRBA3233]|uniref:histidine kinase dimerization/phosphoacceptor domain -containing protein n=1 Tax=Sulfitobacter marinivivus TaxID=3158558 RepID=UPI0032DE30B3